MNAPWVCPRCRGRLTNNVCAACGQAWRINRGFNWFVDDDAVTGSDRRMQGIYDRGARFHDPVLAATFRLFLGSTVADARRTILERLAAKPGDRVLEVGTGTGGNALQLAARGIDYTGVDLAAGMLTIARERLDRAGHRHVPLAIADAHALPLPDQSFDRVLHVGAVNSFREPARALAEMTRVARPGATLILVDEQLAPNAGRSLRWAFRASVFYTTAERCRPPESIPGATIESVEQLTAFFYLMRAVTPPLPSHTPPPAPARLS